MKTAITEFKQTGECKVDVKEVVRLWKDDCFISQWHEQYQLVSDDIKIVISVQQATALVLALDLCKVPSPIFNNAYTWKHIKLAA